MNKQIWSLIDACRGKLSAETFIELFAACSVWLKLSEDKKLYEEYDFKGQATKELLGEMLGSCVDVNFSSENWDIEDSQLTQLLISLKELLRVNVVTYKELSLVIKQLQEDESKKSGSLVIPRELSELGAKLIGSDVRSVYCPFGSGVDFAMQWSESVEKCGESLVDSEVFFAEVHNILQGNNFNTVKIDPIFAPYFIGDGGLKQFDASIAIPPMGMKLPPENINDIWGRFPEKSLMGEVYFLRHMLAHTSNTVVCFVANGFLFRTAAGEKQFKQSIVNHNWLKAVITLPTNLLAFARVSISVLVLDKTKTDSNVKFIDASSDDFIDPLSRTRNKLKNIDEILDAFSSTEESDISVNASPQQIQDNEYNLSPGRYVLSNDDKELAKYLSQFKTAKLEELVEIIRPQALKHSEHSEETYYEYNLSNLDDIGCIQGDGKAICVGQNDIGKAKKQTIKANDVLVVCKGAVGKVGIAGSEGEANAIASQAFAILRIKPHISAITAEVLYQYLTSKYGQQQLSSLATGTSALMLSAKDLNSLEVPLFPAEKLSQIKAVRQQIIDTNKQIQGLRSDIEKLNQSWL